MNKTILITGASSGIGLALAEEYLKHGWHVLTLSRRSMPLQHQNLQHLQLDLAEPDSIDTLFKAWLKDVAQPELVVLNAAVLGEVQDLQQAETTQLKASMQVNCWANKQLLDVILSVKNRPSQVVAISSGAAVKGHRGFSGYALSKAALNMLIELYAEECPRVHFSTLAPGIVNTAMQAEISNVDATDYPVIESLQQARREGQMPSAQELAPSLLKAFQAVLNKPSGSFNDIRMMSV